MKQNMTIHPIDVARGYREPMLTPVRIPVFAYGYLMEGEALVEVEGRNYLLGPGQLMLIPENKEILLRHCKDCQGFDGHFGIESLKDASYPVLRASEPILQSFWFDDAVFIGALMKRMLTAFSDRDTRFMQSAMDLILGQLRPGGKVAAIPEKFLQLVFNRESVPLSVSDYAQTLGVTANYLNKTVKVHTHRTAIDWIEIARLNQAKALLKDRSVPIVEVAERCGLEDQSYFSRFFKKQTGLTPSQYRGKL